MFLSIDPSLTHGIVSKDTLSEVFTIYFWLQFPYFSECLCRGKNVACDGEKSIKPRQNASNDGKWHQHLKSKALPNVDAILAGVIARQYVLSIQVRE